MMKIPGMTSELRTQQPLFPLDPWGYEEVFAVIDHPHPAIARAITGPLILGRDDYAGPQCLRCVALHSGRHFLYSAQIPSDLRFNPLKFWAMVASQFDAPDTSQIGGQLAPLTATPKDSVENWFSNDFWMPESFTDQHLHKAVHALSKLLARHDFNGDLCGEDLNPLRYEQLALHRVNDQHRTAIAQLLQAMVPELKASYIQRPRLSTGIVNRLVAFAEANGVLATKYMLQAIQTESFGLLHLMAFGDGPESQEILEVVLSGDSLPTKFIELGVSKGVHRRTLFRPENSTRQVPLRSLNISDLHLPGTRWLAAMRLTKHRSVYSLEEWQAFGNMLEQLRLLALDDQSLNSALMAYCVKGGYKNCSVVLKRLCSNAHALTQGAQHLAFASLTVESAVCIALEWETHRLVTSAIHSRLVNESDWAGTATLILVVCQVFELDLDAVMGHALNTHPGIPTGFHDASGLRLVPLESMALTLLHGYQMQNCLGDIHSAIDYIADGVALYGVQDNGIAIGTIALKRGIDERDPMVEVLEISDRNNERFGCQLGYLAQSLADKWNGDFDSGAWMRFSAQCKLLSPA